MTELKSMSQAELRQLQEALQARYDAFRARGLSLNMARGKPSPEQCDLSAEMLTCLGPEEFLSADGTDCRNYGGLDGLPEAKALFCGLIDAEPDQIIVGGNSSLNMMYDAVSRAMSHGVPGGQGPWSKQPRVAFICPCPGYDRHFTICKHFGIETIVVDLLADGPDMDAVEALVAGDETIKGIWCVPKYSNPTGATYSDDVVDRLASMRTAAPDFRVMWDNAYAVHHLTDTPDRLKSVLGTCRSSNTGGSDSNMGGKTVNNDRFLVFASTSKITFPGAGVAIMGASKSNLDDARRHLFAQTIGPDKLNQLRHVRFLRDVDGIAAHMKRHAAIIGPKFDAVLRVFETELAGKGIAEWSRPNGGYFVSVDAPDGCAKKVVALAKDAGVTMTGAGATFPEGKDPRDRNLRIAPTFPSLSEVEQAMELIAVCIQLAAVESLLGA